MEPATDWRLISYSCPALPAAADGGSRGAHGLRTFKMSSSSSEEASGGAAAMLPGRISFKRVHFMVISMF